MFSYLPVFGVVMQFWRSYTFPKRGVVVTR